MSHPIRPDESALIDRRAQFFNGHLTQITWGVALGAACSAAPQQLAFVFAFAILAMIEIHDWPHRRVYRLWREVNHQLVQPTRMWRRYSQFLLSWAFLGAVACGFVSNQGFSL